MILVVSHFTKNKGTTDYFIGYLTEKKQPYYYLKHPFFEAPEEYSELLFFDGEADKVLKRWHKSRSALLDLARNFIVSAKVSFSLKKEADQIFSFGGFNVIPFLLTRFLAPHRRIYFWGCDYSRHRFSSGLLNGIYLWFETLSCKYSDKVIQPTKRQQEARIKYHKLNPSRSIVAPNGIVTLKHRGPNGSKKGRAFFYLGSITAQHGIVAFVRRYYVEKKSQTPLYIIGGGDKVDELRSLLSKAESNRIVFYGQASQDKIQEKVKSIPEQLLGLAPYDDSANDHVYYGDSLKIKEYLNYGMPFITSKITYVPDDLKPFGVIYDNQAQLDAVVKDPSTLEVNLDGSEDVLASYDWAVIFDTLLSGIDA